MRLFGVPANAVAAVWPRVEDWIAAACNRPGCDLTADAMRALCLEEKAQLVTIHADDGTPVAAGVTQVRDYESGRRSCWVLAVGGSGARAWRDTLGLIEAGARRSGCDCIEFVGRPGWAALLPGYTAETYFRKALA